MSLFSFIKESLGVKTAAPTNIPAVIPDFLNPVKEKPVSPLIKPIPDTPLQANDPDVFHPGNIIPNSEFTDCDTMSEAQVQEFLVSKGGVILTNYSVNGHLASYWLYKYSKDHGLNPQIVLVHMQKEMGTITRKTPFTNQRKYDYILGVGATDGGDNPKWAGVDKQFEGAILTCKKWYDKGEKLNKYPIIMNLSDRPHAVIENSATFSLYKYTPWIGDEDKLIGKSLYRAPFGNYSFWLIYRKWFK